MIKNNSITTSGDYKILQHTITLTADYSRAMSMRLNKITRMLSRCMMFCHRNYAMTVKSHAAKTDRIPDDIKGDISYIPACHPHNRCTPSHPVCSSPNDEHGAFIYPLSTNKPSTVSPRHAMSNDYGQEPRRRKVTTMLTNALITISITLALYNNYYTVVCCATILLIILLHITCRQRIPPAIMSGTFCLDNNHACNGDGHRRPAVTQHLTPYDDNDEVTILLHPPTPLTPIKSEIRRNELRRITATHRIRAMTAEQPNHNYEDNYKVSRITTWRRRAA